MLHSGALQAFTAHLTCFTLSLTSICLPAKGLHGVQGMWVVKAGTSTAPGFRDARSQRAQLCQLGGSCISSAGLLTKASQGQVLPAHLQRPIR